VPTIPSPRPRDLLADDGRRDELRRLSIDWPSWSLANDALIDLEALLGGWLAPCPGYVVPAAGDSRAAAIPLEPHPATDAPSIRVKPDPTPLVGGGPPGPTLQVSRDAAERAQPGTILALRDPEGVLLAALHVEQRREVDGRWWLGGRIEGVELPAHDDFRTERLTAAAIVDRLRTLGRPHTAAFAPGALLHAATRHALAARAEQLDASVVVMIPSRSAATGDGLEVARLRAMLVSARLLPADRFVIAVAPLVQREPLDLARAAAMARNCGATELLVEAGDAPPDAFGLAARDAGMSIRAVAPFGYDRATRRFLDPSETHERIETSPAARDILSRPGAAPGWLLTEAEIDAWRRACPPRDAQGFAVLLTGLSGSGKSTIARALRSRLVERTGRPVTLLDGDLVRRHLSSELGFSREHRDLNILRIGWVASEIVRHGGIVICAPIAPYDAIRRQVREMIEPVGGFLLVHVATPLETCEARDRKGLYAKARAGLLPNFTGVTDPYEPPGDAAIVIDTRETAVDEACERILARLTSDGYLMDSGSGRIERRS
jgi:sulfate adenylyltransferase